MPQVDFYVTGATADDARLLLACRVTEKAYLAGLRVLVWCPPDEDRARFDELLWTFSDRSFVPHEAPGAPGGADPAPVALSGGIEPSEVPDIVVNLAADIPPIALRAARVAEFIDGDAARRAQGRARFRQYRERGLAPVTHQQGGASL